MKIVTQAVTPNPESAQPPKLPPSVVAALLYTRREYLDAWASLAAEQEDKREAKILRASERMARVAEWSAAQAAARADRAAARAAEKAAILEARSAEQAARTEERRLQQLAECRIGHRFGDLVVEAPAGQTTTGRRLVDAKCACGRWRQVPVRALVTGDVTRCEWCEHLAREAEAAAAPPQVSPPPGPSARQIVLAQARVLLAKNQAVLVQTDGEIERDVEEKARAYSRFHNAEPEEVPAAAEALREVLSRQEAAKPKRQKIRAAAKAAIRRAQKVIASHTRPAKPGTPRKPKSPTAKARDSIKKSLAILKQQDVLKQQGIEELARAHSAAYHAEPDEAAAKGAALRELLARQASDKAKRRRIQKAAKKAIRYAERVIKLERRRRSTAARRALTA